MADVAQLVRALVCGTRCRRFESDLPPHLKNVRLGVFFVGVETGENRRIGLVARDALVIPQTRRL